VVTLRHSAELFPHPPLSLSSLSVHRCQRVTYYSRSRKAWRPPGARVGRIKPYGTDERPQWVGPDRPGGRSSKSVIRLVLCGRPVRRKDGKRERMCAARDTTIAVRVTGWRKTEDRKRADQEQ